MASYTTDDAKRVTAQDMAEAHAYYTRLAAEQRPAVRRAIAHLTNTTPPADTEPDVDDDRDEAEGELDGEAGEQ
ncbi:tagatose-1,6-bisphosphate aldolase [Saccharopolyspora lacisalsi]|uniref:Tagatose-1,6-bisphosphate aldolase n=1 Tax=Halosaccharopolyspora lacisalsi TaxID=1000566 RepID=A0A839DXF7_9PSEU|nr:hypothetical protein [Halosaccharopolyspora lacisalsi]MBA8823901.1 tagatose-1,6-bisphosphate aldolase [Halosaccharopolyspora lacisalsi]